MLAALGLSSLGSAVAAADATTTMRGSPVETDAALFFAAMDERFVFYVPRTEVVVRPATPAIPGVPRWEAAVVMKRVVRPDPGSLRAEWSGKILRPYTFTAAAECVLNKQRYMQDISQTVAAQGRNISAADVSPICAFTFLLPGVETSGFVDRLNELVTSGDLIQKSIALALVRMDSVPWSHFHTTLSGRMGLSSQRRVSREQAAFLLGVAAGGSAASALFAGMTPESAEAFLQDALRTLFASVDSRGLRLVPNAPGGDAVVGGGESTYEL
ncbi:hypothetical protein [Sorangium sp. So ce1151]|uniref:hypothetical protein n=1 Tax=Sorangium sp. So ce1151 TaxID=3133332 RepID=UPI003F5D9EE1